MRGVLTCTGDIVVRDCPLLGFLGQTLISSMNHAALWARSRPRAMHSPLSVPRWIRFCSDRVGYSNFPDHHSELLPNLHQRSVPHPRYENAPRPGLADREPSICRSWHSSTEPHLLCEP